MPSTGAPVELTPEQRAVREEIGDICADFDAAYWRERDRAGEYPQVFVDRLAGAGWPGITLPEAYGGKGLGIPEAVVTFEEIARSGSGLRRRSTSPQTPVSRPPTRPSRSTAAAVWPWRTTSSATSGRRGWPGWCR